MAEGEFENIQGTGKPIDLSNSAWSTIRVSKRHSTDRFV
ncbi:hypothetical protein [Desulfosarcina variabilis]